MTSRPQIDETVLRVLARPRLHRWLVPAMVDWAVIIAVFAAAHTMDHPLVYVLAIVPLGSRQQALGALFHDAAHRLASRSTWTNDIVGNVLAAWPLGLTLGGYRRYHFAHHRHLGTDLDPEITHKRTIAQWSLPASPLRTVRDFASDLVGGGLPHLVAAGSLTRPVSFVETIGIGLFWVATLWIAWWQNVLWIPLLWIISVATVFWSGVRLRIWTEHLGTKDTHRIHVPGWLAHLIMPHDIGLHWEHHHFPNVPFWNLHALRAQLPPGRDHVPPIVSLPGLARSFLLSAPLQSGSIGMTVGPNAATTTNDDAVRAHALRELDVLRFVGHVVMPFVLAVFLYIACRRHVPWVLAWLPTHGFFAGRLPPRLVDWFPDFAWSYSLTALMTLLWASTPGPSRIFWIAMTFVVSIGWEIGQRFHTFPGVFDPGDLVFGIVGSTLAVLSCSKRFFPDLATNLSRQSSPEET